MGRVSPIGIPLSGRVASRLRIPDPTFSLRMSNRMVASVDVSDMITKSWAFSQEYIWDDNPHVDTPLTVPAGKTYFLDYFSVYCTNNTAQDIFLEVARPKRTSSGFDYLYLAANIKAGSRITIGPYTPVMLEEDDFFYIYNANHTAGVTVELGLWGRELDLARVD